MAFQTPKTNWTPANGVLDTDLNRIEGNIDHVEKGLHEWGANNGSTVNNYKVTKTPTETALFAGLLVRFVIPAGLTNTGAVTLQIDALAAKPIVNPDGTALAASDLPAGAVVTVVYDGTASFMLQGKGGVNAVDKQALIDVANAADANNTVVQSAIIADLGSPTVVGDSWQKIMTDFDTQKTNFAANLTALGSSSLSSDSLKSLVDKVAGLVNVASTVESFVIETGETIAVNDLVEILNTGKCREARKFDGAISGASTVLRSVNASGGPRPAAVRIDSTRVLVLNGYGYLQVWTVSGTTITAGTAVAIGGWGGQTLAAIDVLNDTTAIAAYSTNSSTHVASIITISGTTITVGTPTTFSGGTVACGAIKFIDATKAVVTVAVPTVTAAYAYVLSISGTTITVGGSANNQAMDSILHRLVMLSSTTLLLVTLGYGSANSYAVVLTISGTNVSMGTVLTASNYAQLYDVTAFVVNSTTVIWLARNGNATTNFMANLLTVSGTTVTAGTLVTVPTTLGVGLSMCNFVKVNTGVYLALYRYAGQFANMAYITLTGTTIAIEELNAMDFPGMSYVFNGDSVMLDEKTLVINGLNNTTNYYPTGRVYKLKRRASGVAKTAGIAGQTISVATFN